LFASSDAEADALRKPEDECDREQDSRQLNGDRDHGCIISDSGRTKADRPG
jgi:hypothetical protein